MNDSLMLFLAPTIIGVAAVIIGFLAGHNSGYADGLRARNEHKRVTPKV